MSAVSGVRRSMRELVDGTIRVQIDIDPQFRDLFLKLFSQIDIPIALAPLALDRAEITDPDEAPKPEKWAHHLFKGWFFDPKVLHVLGTDEEYRAWIQRQPSAFSGKFSEFVNGEGRCIAAHVRRAAESGTGYKPEFACIPLTDAEHQQQHREGEVALGGREWFDSQRGKHLNMWGHQRLRAKLGVEHLADVSRETFLEWADSYLLPIPMRIRTHDF